MKRTSKDVTYRKLLAGPFDSVEIDPTTGNVLVKKRDILTESIAEVAKTGEIIKAKTRLTWIYWVLVILSLGIALIFLELYRFAVIGFGNNKRNETFVTNIKRCLLSS